MRHVPLSVRPALVVLTLLAALALHGTALAHAQVVAVEPAAGARLDVPPAQVRVIFNEPIATLSSLQLLDARGQEVVARGGPAPEAPEVLALATPELVPGVYTAVWSIIGSDGHVVKGNFAFTVLGAPVPAVPAEPLPAAATAGSTAEQLTEHAPPSPLAVALRGAMLIGAAGAVGGWAFLVALLLPALVAQGAAPAPTVVRHWRRWITALLVLVSGSAALMLLVYTAEIAGSLDLGLLPDVVRYTRYGLLLVARVFLAGALLLLLAPWSAAAPPAGWRGLGELAPIGALLLLTFSLSGHAAAQEGALLPVAADWLHLSATALWLGGLALFALVLPTQLRALPEPTRAPLLGRLFTRFSTLALISVGTLIITGIYAARREISALSELWQTAYGQALLAKLAVFGGLLGFGAYHLLVARPHLEAWATRLAEATLAGRWQRRVGNTLRAEAGLALLAILAAGALTSLPPPSALEAVSSPGTPFRPVEGDTPRVYRQVNEAMVAGDLFIAIDVDPTRVGDNTFTVTVTDDGGRPVQTIQLVRLAFERPDLDIGVTELMAAPESDEVYSVAGPALSVLGDWQLRVLVRRSDADDVEATFTVPVVE